MTQLNEYNPLDPDLLLRLADVSLVDVAFPVASPLAPRPLGLLPNIVSLTTHPALNVLVPWSTLHDVGTPQFIRLNL
jgi:hypothetical protein